MVLALSGLFFVVTGVQYWTSDYIKYEFGTERNGENGVSDDTIAILFALTSFTGPIGGAVAGGITTTKMGGYNNVAVQKL